VIGSGVAGLVAARVLADRCDEVVLLERDGLASASAPDDANSSGSLSDVAAAVSARRRGVPQVGACLTRCSWMR
jgi:glycine/D-amino acid oxidase-like deaminating enzyme